MYVGNGYQFVVNSCISKGQNLKINNFITNLSSVVKVHCVSHSPKKWPYYTIHIQRQR